MQNLDILNKVEFIIITSSTVIMFKFKFRANTITDAGNPQQRTGELIFQWVSLKV